MAKFINIPVTIFPCLLLLLITLTAQIAVYAQDSSYNLACGRRGNFTDSFGIEWIGDVAYLDNLGHPAEITGNYASKFEALNTLRYFVLNTTYNGICYHFNLVPVGTTVTVTTQFYYGNYDGTSSPPTFYVRYDDYNEYIIKTYTDSNVSYTKRYATSNETIFVRVFAEQGDWTTVPFVNTIQIAGPGVNSGSFKGSAGNTSSNSTGSKKGVNVAAIVVPIVVVLLMAVMGLAVCLAVRKRKKKNAGGNVSQYPTTGSAFPLMPTHGPNYIQSNIAQQYGPQGPLSSWPTYSSTGSSNPRSQGGNYVVAKLPFVLDPSTRNVFSYAEILQITNNFGTQIGKGGSGVVYHGHLVTSNLEVAVKVLNESGTKEFVTEVQLLLTVHHKCIARFVGYCDEGQNLILVYEYMKGGNLRQLLSAQGSTSRLLTWDNRLQMAKDVATGLDYLHSHCDPYIIHRDVKTTNILLNEKLGAKIADFGLSKSGLDEDVTYVSTVVAGTPGYLDPEYYATNKLTRKSDVYSFGVVLFELVSGHSPIITIPEGRRCSLVQWMKPLIERGDEAASLADPNLVGQYNEESLMKVAETAAACTAESSAMRPTMADVVSRLKEAFSIQTQQPHQGGGAVVREFPAPSAAAHGLPVDEFVPGSTSSTERFAASYNPYLAPPPAR